MGTRHSQGVGSFNHALTANPNASGTGYADIAARDADTAFNTTATNVNKLVRVESPLSFYILTSITPTWEELGITGTGFITAVGTPVDNQVGVWTGANSIEGTSNFVFDDTTKALRVGLVPGTITNDSQLELTNNVTTGNSETLQRWTWQPGGTIWGLRLDQEFNTANSRIQYNFIMRDGVATDVDVMSFADGKVGILTQLPTSELHVVGDARVTGAFLDSSGDVGTSGQVLSSTVTGTNWITDAGGDVVGPGSSTDNAFTRFDGTTGKLLQNSTSTLSDTGVALFGDGTELLPSVSFTSDPDTGMRRVSADVLGFSVKGFDALQLTADAAAENFLTINAGLDSFDEGFVDVTVAGTSGERVLRISDNDGVDVTIASGSGGGNVFIGRDAGGNGLAIFQVDGGIAFGDYSGASTTDGLILQVKASGASFTQSKFRVESPNTSTKFDIKVVNEVTANVGSLGVTDSNTFIRGSGSFITDGFTAGQTIVTAGFANAQNNGTFIVATVAALTLDITTSPLTFEFAVGGETMKELNTGDVTFITTNEEMIFETFAGEAARFTSLDMSIVGGLTVDTDTLFVDATGNRVGFGTNSPTTTSGIRWDFRGASNTVPLVILSPSMASGTFVGFGLGESDAANLRAEFLYNHNTTQALRNFSMGFHSNPNLLTVFTTGVVQIGVSLDMTSGLINNVLDPVSAQDAATKNYVDTAGHGDVFKVGTPVDDEIAVWTGDGTLEGESRLLFTTSGNDHILHLDASTTSHTGTLLIDSSQRPILEFRERQGSASLQRWNTKVSSAVMTHSGVGSGGAETPYMTLNRTGATIDDIAFTTALLSTSGDLIVDTDTLIVDATNDRVTIGQAATGLTDLTIFQGSNSLKGITLSGVGISGTSTTEGVSLMAGNIGAGNNQFWIVNKVDQGNSGKNSFRFITGSDVPLIVGVNNINTINKNLAFGVNALGAGMAVGFPTTAAQADVDAKVHISTGVASEVGLITQGVTSQTADLFQAKNVGDTVMFAIAADGALKDSSGDKGTSGQILSSTATGTNWIDEVGNVVKVGTPVDNQVGVWTGDGTLEGDAGLIFNGSAMTVANGSPAVIVNNTGGGFKSMALTAGSTASSFLYDDSGNFSIQARTEAQVLAGSPNQNDSTLFITSGEDVGIGNIIPLAKLHVTGTGKFTGALDMTSQLINNVLDPVSAQDAATKNYVDTQGFVSTVDVLDDLTFAIGNGTTTLKAADGPATTARVYTTSTFDHVCINPEASGESGFKLFESTGTTSKVEMFYNETVNATGIDASVELDIISSAELKLTGGTDLTFISNTGSYQFQPTVDAVNKFRIQNSGSATVFSVDTTNQRVGIGITAPTAELEVISGGSVVNLIVQASEGQTADLFHGENSGGTPVFAIGAGGHVRVRRVATAVSDNTADEVIIGVTSTAAARTITIQTADIVAGRLFIIKDESGAASVNNITIATQASETIDGASTVAITQNHGVVRLYAATATTLFSW